MSLTTIAARLTDAPVKLDGAQERRILRTLKMIYEGGSLDGKTANFPTRDLSCVVIGRHRGNWHFFDLQAHDLDQSSQPTNNLSLRRAHC